jgi:hypothetical protein
MTVQEAAARLLREAGKPLPSVELAQRMLRRDLVRSNAQDPIASFAQTIEKNIRGGVYNRPELEFVYTPSGRLIGLPAWSTDKPIVETPAPSPPGPTPFRVIGVDERAQVEVQARLLNKLHLIVFAGLALSIESAADLAIERGLDAMKDEIAAGMREALVASR